MVISPKRLNMTRAWKVIPFIFSVLVVYLAVGAIAADKLTKPRRVFTAGHTPAMMQLSYEDIQFQSRDGAATISAWYIPSTDHARVVILVHGRSASRTEMFFGHSLDLALALHQAGFSVMMIDLRGHGESSDGRFTYGLSERYDVLGAVDWLINRGYQPGKIGVMGISLGSAAAIGAAANDDRIGAVVSDSGFAEIYPLMQSNWIEESGLPVVFLHSTRLMIWLKYGYDIPSSRPVADLEKVAPRPVLLIHCLNDEMIPYAHVQQLRAAAPGSELWTILACLHGESYNADPAGYEDHLIDFFQSGLE
jgi:fermentation-respiration switch protein FrsA (DUF1100 family)